MTPAHANEIRALLLKEFGFKERGPWLQQGRCPQCQKKELFTHAESPWLVKCGRENKCGYEITVKELYPQVFANFNERYRPTDQDPNATANAYLAQHRGFPISEIEGWYEQGKYWNPNIVGGKGTATVRFYLDACNGFIADGKRPFMERFVEELTILDPKTGEKKQQKAHFQGTRQGLWWQPPGLTIDPGDEIWLVEGVLDAIALNLSGVKAVSVMSCNSYPDKSLEPHLTTRNITWRWALDNDPAGIKYTRRNVKRMRDAGLTVKAAFPPEGKSKVDWNDLYLNRQLDDDALEEYRYQGDLFTCRNAAAKAALMYGHEGQQEFIFDHGERLYAFKLDVDKFHKILDDLESQDEGLSKQQMQDKALQQSGSVKAIANCNPKFLYVQSNTITDEVWFYCQVTSPTGKPTKKGAFTPSQTYAVAEFKKRLGHVSQGGLFKGTAKHHDMLIEEQLFNLKTVETVDFIGYSKAHGTYVFDKHAVKDGRIIEVNEEDYFTIGQTRIKSLNKSLVLHIEDNEDDYREDWVDLIYQAWGAQGIVALAWWVGSLFCEQIRRDHKGAFPFLEVVGEAGTGKSTLIEFMWRLFGRINEGTDPNKGTQAGRARGMNQVSGMPVVFIESDREEDFSKGRRFDWNEIKDLYNGRTTGTRGQRTGGNETYEPLFKGSICISQNAMVKSNDAIMSRICHLFFKRDRQTADSKIAADAIARIDINEVSRFILHATCREADYMAKVLELAPKFEHALGLREDVKMVRITETHGLLMALVNALPLVCNIETEYVDEAEQMVIQMAADRQLEMDADHPVVAQFWEVYDYLSTLRANENDFNHFCQSNIDQGLIAVNLNHFYQAAMDRRQELPLMVDLKKHLKTSRTRKFREIKAVTSRVWDNKTARCWVFEGERP